ncbi:MAG: C39 family peptidase [Candidatus Omnitrophica bacterium]|nr:C39 family peptidase [Candidatus Omnitrophota bacterium]
MKTKLLKSSGQLKYSGRTPVINVKILSQPDDVTCGPTSLHAVYSFYRDNISLRQVIKEVSYLEEGGTLAVLLGKHALGRGYEAEIYTYNLKIFDPTWSGLTNTDILNKLNSQLAYKKGKKFEQATLAYMSFIKAGGIIRFKNLSTALLKDYFEQNIPVLAGLSSTYLYQCAREYTGLNDLTVYDDVRGYPSGHFVVLCGYDQHGKQIVVADPYKANPISSDQYYSVNIGRLINAIMLGILTYDANLLIIKPRKRKG